MSAIRGVIQGGVKRTHADEKDPSEPTKQLPRLEHFDARLNEA
jgi:hypothetical protein